MTTEIQAAFPTLATPAPDRAADTHRSAPARTEAQAQYPMPKLSGPLAQRAQFSVEGLDKWYTATLEGDDRLLFNASIALMRKNNIPTTDSQAGFIVSGLLFLSRLDVTDLGLPDQKVQAMQQLSNYARARLDSFLAASKANADSGGQHPPDPVLANVRTQALAVVNKYLGHEGRVPLNVKPAPFVPHGATTI
jgi:hypothetical protein